MHTNEVSFMYSNILQLSTTHVSILREVIRIIKN